MKQIKSALISVFHKDGLEDILKVLKENGVKIYSTGGTYDFLKAQGFEPETVESVTGYPSILGGRVKTLHPGVMGGILGRRENAGDVETMAKYKIPEIDMVVVDLYPFEDTVASGASDADIIEKIDIGGISLIRAGAKNFNDVLIVPSREHYAEAARVLKAGCGATDLDTRRRFAAYAFLKSSSYDRAIAGYFCMTVPGMNQGAAANQGVAPANQPAAAASKAETPQQGGLPGGSQVKPRALRYGENPHQQGAFYGDLDQCFEILHGKEVSYNNLLDIDAALNLMGDFGKSPAFAILKHNNPCGFAIRPNLFSAFQDALAGDPVSAFGGVLCSNSPITMDVAEEINKIFLEVLLAPDYEPAALELLKSKKNRILLRVKDFKRGDSQVRSCLNGVLVQDRDSRYESIDDFKQVTKAEPTQYQLADMVIAQKIVKHCKSNAIVICKNGQLLASGVGQTSRVDALQHAIDKAKHFGFDLNGAVVGSDAFFPFADCVEISHKAGIAAFIQPGGSVRDNLSIEYCDEHNLPMVFTGIRHFRH